MIAVVNDVSFQETYGTIELAEQGMNQFLDICKQIETNEITNVHEIRTGLIDTQVIIAPSYKLIQLLQGFREREERTLLISILTNRGTYKTDEGDTCEINGKTSYVCAQGIDNFLIKYPNSMKRWKDNWDAISPIFKFSTAVRKVIYTTNAIESLNSTYRRLNRQRSVFPSDTALLKALYLATFEATKRWTSTIRNWGQVYGELSIMYENRLPE